MPMDIRTGITQAAQALGMNPVDLATIISYETGGTFNPTAQGPGGHRGLIQFGQPEQQQYGVNWNDPLGSQLGPNGAIVRYLKDRGYKPGMTLPDVYSIVNAGSPGRMGATDAATGGAPGTVADKVATMQPHQAKAQALLGGARGGPVEAAGGGAGNEAAGSQVPSMYNFSAPAAGTAAPPPPEPVAPDFSAYNAALAEQQNNPFSSLASTLAGSVAPGGAAAQYGIAGDESVTAPPPDFASARPPPAAAPEMPPVTADPTALADIFKVAPVIGKAQALNTDTQGNPIRRRMQG
jgi:hypothetical protein